MKRIESFIFALMLVFSFSSAGFSAVENGAMAPNFKLTDSNGQSHQLTDFKGKYVVLEWTNYDCPFVKKHYGSGNMQNLQNKLTSDGVVWLSINSSAPGKQGNFSPEEINKRFKEAGAAATAYLMDASGKVGKLYGAQTTPHVFLINPEGVLVYQGAIDSIGGFDPADIKMATNYIDQAYAEAKAGKDVSVPFTKSYGCSVKY